MCQQKQINFPSLSIVIVRFSIITVGFCITSAAVAADSAGLATGCNWTTRGLRREAAVQDGVMHIRNRELQVVWRSRKTWMVGSRIVSRWKHSAGRFVPILTLIVTRIGRRRSWHNRAASCLEQRSERMDLFLESPRPIPHTHHWVWALWPWPCQVWPRHFIRTKTMMWWSIHLSSLRLDQCSNSAIPLSVVCSTCMLCQYSREPRIENKMNA